MKPLSPELDTLILLETSSKCLNKGDTRQVISSSEFLMTPYNRNRRNPPRGSAHPSSDGGWDTEGFPAESPYARESDGNIESQFEAGLSYGEWQRPENALMLTGPKALTTLSCFPIKPHNKHWNRRKIFSKPIKQQCLPCGTIHL